VTGRGPGDPSAATLVPRSSSVRSDSVQYPPRARKAKGPNEISVLDVELSRELVRTNSPASVTPAPPDGRQLVSVRVELLDGMRTNAIKEVYADDVTWEAT
jgi:hypothetical protein